MRAPFPRSILLLLVAAVAGGAPVAAQDLWVYDDALVGGFADWSWAARNLAATGDVHSAPNAISWEPDNWQGLYFHNDAGFDCAVMVDEVQGLKHFTAEAFREGAAGVVAELAPFVEGVYTGTDGEWAVFRPDALVGDSRFLDAAR